MIIRHKESSILIWIFLRKPRKFHFFQQLVWFVWLCSNVQTVHFWTTYPPLCPYVIRWPPTYFNAIKYILSNLCHLWRLFESLKTKSLFSLVLYVMCCIGRQLPRPTISAVWRHNYANGSYKHNIKWVLGFLMRKEQKLL